MSEPKTPLSASRIKTLQSCSWLYYSKYVLNLPDGSNDGAKRGSICHLVFEVLGNSRHKKKYAKIIKKQDVFAVPSVQRLIEKHARISEVADEENIALIKEMTLNGLNYDFFGGTSGKPSLAVSEQDFDIVVNNKRHKYRIKGFIDKLFLYKKDCFALIRDFKTSKQKFKGKEVDDNLQDYMYSLAVKHLFPEYVNRISEFLFLKFPLEDCKDSGIIKMKPIDEDDLDGFETQLTQIQNYIDNFSVKDAVSNLAARQPYPSDNSFSGPLQCGRAKYPNELKKDGSIMWHCPMKFGFEYYVTLNEDNVAIKSYLNIHEIPSKAKYEKRKYEGCPAIKKVLDTRV
jgi:hypothetical protein